MIRFALATAFALLLSGCGGGGGSSSPPQQAPYIPPLNTVPVFGPSRKELDFAYFGGSDDAVLPFVSLTFATTWGNDNPEWIVDDLQRAKLAGCRGAIVAIDWLVYTMERPRLFRPDAAERLRMFFTTLRDADLLAMVCVLYPVDEPERESDISADAITTCNACIRVVCSEFGIAPLLACIYGDTEDYRGAGSYDWVGLDAYRQGTDAFSGMFPRLRAQLRPDQRLIEVPMCADPHRMPVAPWYDYAQANPDVALLCPFLWVDYTDSVLFAGANRNGLGPEYNAAAAAIRAAV